MKSSEKQRQEEEKEYQDFLEKWGDVDFALLDFLPAIKTNDQVEAYERVQNAKGDRMQRTKKIFQGKQLDEEKAIDPNDKKKRKKKKTPPKKQKKAAPEKEMAFD